MFNFDVQTLGQTPREAFSTNVSVVEMAYFLTILRLKHMPWHPLVGGIGTAFRPKFDSLRPGLFWVIGTPYLRLTEFIPDQRNLYVLLGIMCY